jgi:hypothetical protein
MNTYVEIKGGLGNILFQVATGISYSLKNNKNFFIDSSNHFGAHFGIGKYLQNILFGLKTSTPENFETYDEKGFEYNIIPKYESNLKLRGYFQSEKYFNEYRNEILEIFVNKNNFTEKVKNYLNVFNHENIVSVHVRRGDYVHLQNYHTLLDLDYYKNASTYFDDDTLFIVFSDDIEWCKINFDFIKNKFFVSDLDDFESLYVMSKCHSHIIANSTFSWWGAWLNKKEIKKIICPKKWFGPMNHHLDTKDLYCDSWIKI